MPSFSAKDIQSLRQSTGVGMLDAKKALEANDGDFDASVKWLREKGLASAAKRTDREASEGVVAAAQVGNAIALIEVRSETDFVAKSTAFVDFCDRVAHAVAAEGTAATEGFTAELEEMLITLKENMSFGAIHRLEVADGQHADIYLHRPDGHCKNGVVVVLQGGSVELAHDIAQHASFTKPSFVSREEVPEADVKAEQETIEAISRNEGKPEASLPKIIEGRLNGWFKERVLLEQGFIKDEKVTIAQHLGDAKIVGFAQILIGA